MVDCYNLDVSVGEDCVFFKFGLLVLIVEVLFYVVEVRFVIFCWMGMGFWIDVDICVLNKVEKFICGLYVVGEIVGNLYGDRYIGGGGLFGLCIVFGKVVGEIVVKYVCELND